MGQLNIPDVRATISSILKRLDLLERRLLDFSRRKKVVDVPFSLAGPLNISESTPYYVQAPSGTAFQVFASLRTPGTTATTVVVRKNGEDVASVTIPANTDFEFSGMSTSYSANSDEMTVAITTVGTGAGDLTVQVRLKVPVAA